LVEQQYYATLDRIQESHWWYSGRRKIISSVLERAHRDGVPKGTLYDLGCGVGANLPVLEKFGPTVGVDVSQEAIDFCKLRGRPNVIRTDLNSLQGIADNSGSVVMLADVIEHLEDERACLQAAHRALAKGGVLLVTVPAYRFLWSPADELAHHHRRYTAGQLRRVIEPLFRIDKLTYFNTLLFGLVAVGRLGERLLRRSGEDTADVQPALNAILEKVFAAEASVVPRHSFPFGVSLLCVARKE
jgi:SAM-dependent methyltransferase